MNNRIDDLTMLQALTDGIGADLGRPIRASFFELFGRLKKHERFLALETLEQQQLVDLLALSIFYNHVIVPLESGSSLLSLVRMADATHIRLGRDKLTPKLAARFRACAWAFLDIIRQQNIPKELLSFPTLNAFIANYKVTRDHITHEAMD